MRPCSREEGRFSPLRTAAPHSYACLEKDEYCQDGAGERPQSPLQCIQANDSIRTETNKKVVKMKSKRYRKNVRRSSVRSCPQMTDPQCGLVLR
ncbi:uncharacterized protein ACNLHF_001110 isoform 5-T5 [Anomaloglossus baeobatrachus]